MSLIKLPLLKPLKIALLQLSAGANKQTNLLNVENHVAEALKLRPDTDLIMLPECFNSPYAVDKFREYSEVVSVKDGETTKFLSNLAKSNNVFLVGGSIPELDPVSNQIYNTSLTFDRNGELIGKHRKAHLFDIDIKGGIRFKESDSLSPGNKASYFNLNEFGNIGLGICYDIRFPELAAIAQRKANAFAMFYPGAFNTTTGPLHWHLLARSRAVDNQFFVVLCSPARDLSSSYHAYGHSLVVDPNGNIVAEAGTDEEILFAELDPSLLPTVRSSIPITFQRRFDIYDDVASSYTPAAN
ncbi:putative hydrolase [Ascoidea rubescens DSM 1968]|uniref:Carbon-nitrogen hydrolase n=1 Tax=Ascoidea rubescens DSM 1968 TaxID=1344418 RepID=A0A1D2VBU1_9ASCO|nr:carbon-nitrogen hydrolase [Ascoidea rubescens DSM 1968]ODV59022.1 carbon-nitrogen hydrolase [Ascoidea rubescens DSM 1968]